MIWFLLAVWAAVVFYLLRRQWRDIRLLREIERIARGG